MSPPKEKERPAGSKPNAQREANVTHRFPVKALRSLESELAENITALFVAAALLLLFS
jgi:hypothetical protein